MELTPGHQWPRLKKSWEGLTRPGLTITLPLAVGAARSSESKKDAENNILPARWDAFFLAFHADEGKSPTRLLPFV
jgi:hypothetical protein